MKIFISYAHEDFKLADALAVGLAQEGHSVFFDRDDLRGGDAYHARIRERIASADLFVFLLSPQALEPACYALTELALARERWARPRGHVLPVLVRPVDAAQVPAYLGALTYLQTAGNPIADVLARVDAVARAWRRRRYGMIALAALVVIALGVGVVLRERNAAGPTTAPLARDYSVSGTLADLSTEQAVMGATVTLRAGERVLDSARSDASGAFALSFSAAAAAPPDEMELVVEHAGFVSEAQALAFAADARASAGHTVMLMPSSIQACRTSAGHAVVVGYFRPPAALPAEDLSGRIRDALEYALMPRLQQGPGTRDDPPILLVCDAARPQSDSYYAGYARALHADAFLGGYVTKPDPLPTVVMKIASRFDPEQRLAEAASAPVDLDDPRAARLGRDAHLPILIALASGYEQAGAKAECVEVTTAAEGILGGLPVALQRARERCQAALPNRGLLPQ